MLNWLRHYWVALGIGALLWDGLKRVGTPVIGLLIEAYDQKVWDVVKQPRYRPRPGGQVQFIGAPEPKYKPYTSAEIAAELHRKEFMIIRSLKRLERRGKIKESHDGWYAS